MKQAGSLLGPIVKSLGIESGVCLSRIKNDWHTLFGNPLSKHMSPSKLTRGELLLNVDSPIWIQQLNFYKREIKAKLDPYGVREIRFRIGKVVISSNENEKCQKLPELSSEDAGFIAGLAEKIDDAELRSAVRGAAEKSLRAKNKRQR